MPPEASSPKRATPTVATGADEHRPRREHRGDGRAGRRVRRRELTVEDVNVVDRPQLRKAVTGTVVGNAMEWYDFGIYGYLAVTMGQVFFPADDPGAQLLASLAAFAVSFLMRPLGGLVFGPLGDKIGRQRTLAVTMLMMAAGTFAIGLLPTFEQVGVLAPVLLVLLRMVQGFSTGGEYAGATTFVTEYAPDRRRGFLASLLDVGSYLGFAIGAATVSIFQLTLGEAAMLDGGWRWPFLIAGPIGLIGLYFRLRIEESPQFEANQALREDAAAAGAGAPTEPRLGLAGIVRAHWRELLIALFLVAAANTVGYALTSYMPTYLTDTLGYDALHGTVLTIPVLVAMSAGIPLTGRLSDRFGRRPVLAVAAIATIVLMIPAFSLLAVGALWSTILGLCLVALCVMPYVANLASSLPALFPTASRYGAMGVAYNFAVAIFGGTTPLLVQGLIELTGQDMVPAWYLMFFSVLGLIAIWRMPETAGRPMLGSMPNVQSDEEAAALVAGQHENDRLDLDALPFATAPVDPTPHPEAGTVEAGTLETSR
ncbi:MFS transporter [Tersicoccus solisilvae]|uniref:MFS transporter n=1 Tax=Tersicoccus solisilvae TaxID=1882339 RepID=A0ABQ1NKL2_9MICC|nr:MFS transporter [Tersicoccus solisilvae]GGC78820.1 MFS transporter [Tersicoccus solisilvae]